MTIRVYYPDYNPKHETIMRAVAKGIPGATVHEVKDYQPSDVAVIFGWWKKAYTPTMAKRTIIRGQQANRGKLLVIESAFVQRGLYYQAGWGGFAGNADFRLTGREPLDRWRKIGMDVKQWQFRPQGPVVLMGQLPRDTQVQHFDYRQWARETYKELKRQGGEVLFRPHPKDKEAHLFSIPCDSRDLNETLRDARAVVTYNSTSAVDAVLAGVPAVACSDSSIAWPVTSHTLNMSQLARPDRTHWLAGLGYSQWTLDEFRNGDAWRWLSR